MSKTESLAQNIEHKCEEQKECYREMEELTRRLRKLRLMLQKLAIIKDGIKDVQTVASIKSLITRYDQCVKSVDLAIIHSAVRTEQKNAGQNKYLMSNYGESSRLTESDSKLVNIDGQQIVVPASESMEAVLERSKRLEDLRKDVSEVMEIFQDVKELVHHQHERVESIGDHVQEAKDNAVEAESQLARSARFSQTALGWGVAGAALGTVLGGPVGFCLGSKAGAAIGLALGGTTGTMSALKLRSGIKRQHEEVQEEAEMQIVAHKNKSKP
eukprot:CAMPEP_0184487432 /NCGR_PEP_ID=MMETSP0113_2-20130426/10085_1 /TAXON_ID=91329 /ORGANISM="Norrisiella sphaerica, Strain BC52" /LENGTH=270 /DNA_ID=CAMNT_0026869751 /DNA_START=209 /DNA_END=1021 /DNA_ORIENTATION=-